MKSVFNLNDSKEIIERISQLTPDTKGLWGIMSVAQMLAHCNVTYEMAYENIHPAPNSFVKFMLKLFVKKSVVNETPYKKSIQTAPAFIIKENKDFYTEKERLINYIIKTQELGKNYFEGWFYKCVDKNGENIFAIIPGVSFGGIESDKHSFIQVLNGITGQVHYFIYKFEDFSSSKKDFEKS